MKIYIVTSGDYSEYEINAVFTSEDKANEYALISNKNGRYERFRVEAYEADAPMPKHYYAVVYRPLFGKRAYVGDSILEIAPYLDRVTSVAPETIVALVPGRDDEYMGTAFGLTVEHAEKNLWDAIAKAKAEAAGV